MNYSINPSRWYLKKAARFSVVKLSKLFDKKNSIPALHVLTYHRFNGNKYDPVSITLRNFENQLAWLSNNLDILSPDAFIQALGGMRKLDRHAVLITVDDGHRSFYDYAYPVLKHHKLPAILFICPDLVCYSNPLGDFMGWHDLSNVLNDGIYIGSHGLSHRSLGKLSIGEAEGEILAAKHEILRYLNIDTPFFAFPFGTRRDFSNELADILANFGYRYCFTSIHGSCTPLSRPNLYPRIKVESGESLEMFIATTQGYLDGWQLIDNLGWRLQQRDRF